MITFLSPEFVAAQKNNAVDYQADYMNMTYYSSLNDLMKDVGTVNSSLNLGEWLTSQKGSPAVQIISPMQMTFANYGSQTVYAVDNAYPSTSNYVEISNKIFIFKNKGSLSSTDKNILLSIKVAQ